MRPRGNDENLARDAADHKSGVAAQLTAHDDAHRQLVEGQIAKLVELRERMETALSAFALRFLLPLPALAGGGTAGDAAARVARASARDRPLSAATVRAGACGADNGSASKTRLTWQ